MAEIKTIDVRRSKPIEIDWNRRRVEQTRRRRDTAVKGFEVIAAVSLGLNVLQAVVIYILQAGPM